MLKKDEQVGKYIVLEDMPIGEGKGTFVYKVKDVSDNKIYALKILKEGFPKHERRKLIDQLERDYLTTKELLKHPNILKSYDDIKEDPRTGSVYIITEYFEGKTIKEFIDNSKVINTREIADIFIQCANALVHSHRQGVYHGDISPGNILVCRHEDNKIEVKIIDFGLARLQPSIRRIRPGSTILEAGTYAYAAPERLEDQPADARSDIYSLGMILYETISSDLPFRIRSSDITSVIAYHKKNKSPRNPLAGLSNPSDIERGLGYVAMRAISRRRFRRFSTMIKMRDALEKASSGEIGDAVIYLRIFEPLVTSAIASFIAIFTSIFLQRAYIHLESWFSVSILVILTILIGLTVWGFLSWWRTTSKSWIVLSCITGILASIIFLSRDQLIGVINLNPSAIASTPTNGSNPNTGIQITTIPAVRPSSLPTRATSPSTTATANNPTTVTEVPIAISRPLDSSNGRIAFISFRDNGGLYLVNADGSSETLITSGSITDPVWSPDGTRIAYVSQRDGNQEIYVMNADGSNQTKLTNNPAADNDPQWSPDSTNIAFVSNRDDHPEIYVTRADGSNEIQLTQTDIDLVASFFRNNSQPTWSPDGKRIAFISSRDGGEEVYIMNSDGSGQTRLTNNKEFETNPVWLADNKRIAFLSKSVTSSNYDIHFINVDGSGQTPLTSSGDIQGKPAWSPDSTRVAYVSRRDDNVDIYLMNADGSGQIRLTKSADEDNEPAWSPDGTRIAYVSQRDGNQEIYVMNADGSGRTRLTNNNASDWNPTWQP